MKSSESFFDLMKGTSAPYFFATEAISLSSVLTIILSKHLLAIAFFIDHAIIGFPKKFLIFFFFYTLTSTSSWYHTNIHELKTFVKISTTYFFSSTVILGYIGMLIASR